MSFEIIKEGKVSNQIYHIVLPHICRKTMYILLSSNIETQIAEDTINKSFSHINPDNIYVILLHEPGSIIGDKIEYRLVYISISNEIISKLIYNEFKNCKFYVGTSEKMEMNVYKERPHLSKLSYINFDGYYIPYETHVMQMISLL
jgi:hypothetical protein